MEDKLQNINDQEQDASFEFLPEPDPDPILPCTMKEAYQMLQLALDNIVEELNACDDFDEVMASIDELDPPNKNKVNVAEQFAPFFTLKDPTIYDHNAHEIWYRVISENFNPEQLSFLETKTEKIFLITDIKRAFDNIDPAKLEVYFETNQNEVVKQLKNFFCKWLQIMGSEKLKFSDDFQTVRSKGLPQGAQWTPSMWNMYLSMVIDAIGIGKNTLAYADNIFIALPMEQASEAADLIKAFAAKLEDFGLTLNLDETSAIWFNPSKSVYGILKDSGFQIPKTQTILGYSFRYDHTVGFWKYVWKSSISYLRPWQIEHSPFKVKLQEYFSRQIGKEIYRLIGFLLFASNLDRVDLDEYSKSIYKTAHTWLGMERISYVDLVTLNLDPRWLAVKMIVRGQLWHLRSKLDNFVDMKEDFKEEAYELAHSQAIFPHSKQPFDDLIAEVPSRLNIPNWIEKWNLDDITKHGVQLAISIASTIKTKHLNIIPPHWDKEWNSNSDVRKLFMLTQWILKISDPKVRLGAFVENLSKLIKYESFWYIHLNKEFGSNGRIDSFLKVVARQPNWDFPKLKDHWLHPSQPNLLVAPKIRAIKSYKLLDSFLAIINDKMVNESNGYWTEICEEKFQILLTEQQRIFLHMHEKAPFPEY
jgi:hypothetical protein